MKALLGSSIAILVLLLPLTMLAKADIDTSPGAPGYFDQVTLHSKPDRALRFIVIYNNQEKFLQVNIQNMD
jgi:hypothetical protein